jgi:spore maturation protein CgeB
MSLRLLKIVAYNGVYLRQFYTNRPALLSEPYAQQHSALMDDAFDQAKFLSAALDDLGYQTENIVVNAEPMQKRWAADNNVAYSDDDWMLDIVFAQIRQWRPDVLLIVPWERKFGAAFVTQCRAISPSIGLVMGQCGEAHPPASFYRSHDLVITCAPEVVSYLRSEGVDARLLSHAFDPQILAWLEKTYPDGITPNADVGFSGQFIFGDQFHTLRAKTIYDIGQHLDLVILGDVVIPPGRAWGNPRAYLRDRYYALLRQLPPRRLVRHMPRYENAKRSWQRHMDRQIFETLRAWSRPPVFGLEMYHTIAGFKIHFNAHGPATYASNRRLFETTGIGTCLLTDWKPNISEFFEPDTEIVTYRSADEAVEKAAYLLAHDDQRRAIAAAGQRRTLRDHTIGQRAAVVHEIISGYFRGQ